MYALAFIAFVLDLSRRAAVSQAAPQAVAASRAYVGSTIVAERAIGIEGPIREYFLVPFTEPDLSRHRTEICWPVFQTA